MDTLELEPSLYREVDSPIHFRNGVFDITLNDGVMVPVFSGRFAGAWETEGPSLLRRLREADAEATLPSAEERGSRELVGFVWIKGSGTLRLSLPYEADAMELANRQVLYAGADVAAMRPVAKKKEPFVVGASEGLFLSVDPEIERMFLGDPDGDPYEIVVYEDRADVGWAARVLEQRLKLWDDMGVDFGERIAEERTDASAGQSPVSLFLADVFTDTRYARISEMASSEDQWLALVDQGLLSRSWTSEVFAAGRTPSGGAHRMHVSGVPAAPVDPNDPDSAPAPAHRMTAVEADARVLVQHPRNALSMHVEITNRIRLKAVRPTAFVTVSVPRVASKEGEAGFRWIRATLSDGTALARPEQVSRAAAKETKTVEEPKPKPKGSPWEIDKRRERDEVVAHEVRLVFPEPLEVGQEVEVDLQWADEWPFAHVVEETRMGGLNPGSSMRNIGNTSGLQRFLPAIDGDLESPWTYRVAVGVPFDSKLGIAVSGVTASDAVEGDWRMVKTERVENARFPNVVVGRYLEKPSAAKKGFPAMNTLLLNGDAKQLAGMAPAARSAMQYFQGFLPEFPLDEYEIVETAAAYGHFTWVAPHGMMVIQRMRVDTIGEVREDVGRAVFAHEIAHQWWGQMAQPASLDDRWMVETFAEVFSCMYTAKANDDVEVCLDRHDETRKLAEGEAWFTDRRFSASLTDAFYGGDKGSVVYRVGPYVMQQMLRPRIGNAAFFEGLSTVLREHPFEPITNERLQHAFEAASGRDLSAFFDYWVRQGLIPKVTVAWTAHPGSMELELTSDVPFGTFDIPVLIQGDYASTTVMIPVVDGRGYFELEGDFRRGGKVVVDPEHRTLARAKRAQKK